MLKGILIHARLAWLLGFRSRAFRGLAAIGVFLLVVAWLSGSFSMRQPAIVATDVGFSGLRLLGTFFVLYWVQEIFVKDFERRTINMALAYPVPRAAYLVGRWLGVVALVTMTIAIWAVGLAFLSQVPDWGYVEGSRPHLGGGFVLVLLGIFLDLLVVAMFTAWLASLSETPMLPFLGGAAFAVAARLIGPSMDYLLFSTYADKAANATLVPLFQALSWLVPDLSRLDWRGIVLYGVWPDTFGMLRSAALALGYLTVFGVLASINYRRREFS